VDGEKPGRARRFPILDEAELFERAQRLSHLRLPLFAALVPRNELHEQWDVEPARYGGEFERLLHFFGQRRAHRVSDPIELLLEVRRRIRGDPQECFLAGVCVVRQERGVLRDCSGVSARRRDDGLHDPRGRRAPDLLSEDCGDVVRREASEPLEGRNVGIERDGAARPRQDHERVRQLTRDQRHEPPSNRLGERVRCVVGKDDCAPVLGRPAPRANERAGDPANFGQDGVVGARPSLALLVRDFGREILHRAAVDVQRKAVEEVEEQPIRRDRLTVAVAGGVVVEPDPDHGRPVRESLGEPVQQRRLPRAIWTLDDDDRYARRGGGVRREAIQDRVAERRLRQLSLGRRGSVRHRVGCSCRCSHASLVSARA
jgi:hypothetical protein